MTLDQANQHIKNCADRMNSAYRKVVFTALTNDQVKHIVAPVSPHANSGTLAAR